MKRIGLIGVVLFGVLTGAQCDNGDWGNFPKIRTTLSGVAYLRGPVANTPVEVYDFRKGQKGRLWGQGSTDDSGTWSIDLGNKYSDMLVEVKTTPHPISATITGIELGGSVEGIAVTPITTLAAAYASHLVTSGKKESMKAALQQAERVVYEHFGNVDHKTLFPVGIGEDRTNFSDELKAGILIAGLDELATSLSPGANLETLLERLCADVRADGIFNGKDEDRALTLGKTPLGGDTLRPHYASAIVRVLGSAKNKTHFTAKTLDDLTRAIAGSTAEIFEGNPGLLDTNPPEISVQSPTAGAALFGVIHARAVARDNEGEVVDLSLLSPPGVIDTDESPATFDGTVDTAAFKDGDLTLIFEARDRSGNVGTKSLSLNVKNQGALVGYVFKGFVDGAVVTAYPFDPTQTKAQLASTTTNKDGRFSLTLGSFKGPLLLIATLGSYMEEALEKKLDLSRGDYLSAVVPDYTPAYVGTVTVSPLTTWAEAYARHLVKDQGEAFLEASEKALEVVSRHFKGLDLLGTTPMDLLAGHGCETLTDRVLYSLYCAGLTEEAYRISVDSSLTPGAVVNGITLTDVLADDISDGLLNGRKGAEQLKQGSYLLNSYTLRTELARAINSYLARQQHCPIKTDDFIDAASQLAESDSELFPGNSPAIPVDPLPPVITFESHPDQSPVRGIIQVVVKATDTEQLKDFAIASPEGLVSTLEKVDRKNWKLSFVIDSRLIVDGPFPVRYVARDRNDNQATAILNLLVDNTLPQATWTEPADQFITKGPNLTFSGTASDGGSGIARVLINGVDAVLNGTAWSYQASNVSEGALTYEVVVTDRAGNQVSMMRTALVDKTPPVFTLKSYVWQSDRKYYPCICTGALCASQCAQAIPTVTMDRNTFFNPPTFEKIGDRMEFNSDGDIASNNLPVFYLLASDDNGPVKTPADRLKVAYRVVYADAPGGGSLKSTPYAPGGGYTHKLPVSTNLSAIVSSVESGSYSLEVRVTDQAGNSYNLSFPFRIQLLPPPLEITVDPDYPNNRTDPHSLYALATNLESCARTSNSIDCNMDKYEELFEPSTAHPLGLRVAHIQIRNPNAVAVELVRPAEIMGTPAKVSMLSGTRLLGYQLFASDANHPGCSNPCAGTSADSCPANKCLRNDFWDYGCNGACNQIVSFAETRTEAGDLSASIEVRKDTPTGELIQPVPHGTTYSYTLSPGTNYHLYTNVNRAPSYFHLREADPIDFQATSPLQRFSYRYHYRGKEPTGTVYIRRDKFGVNSTRYEYLRPALYEKGFEVNHSIPRFEFQACSSAGCANGTLLPLNQTVSARVSMDTPVLGFWPYQ